MDADLWCFMLEAQKRAAAIGRDEWALMLLALRKKFEREEAKERGL